MVCVVVLGVFIGGEGGKRASVLIYVLLINHTCSEIRLQSSTHIDLLLLIKSNRICFP